MDACARIAGRKECCWTAVAVLAAALLSAVPIRAQEGSFTEARPYTIPPSIAPIFNFRAGDALRITVYPDTARFPSGTYFIDSDGFVDLPLVGFINVTELSPQTLEQMLTEKYIKYLPHPNLVVRPLIRVSLLGGFLRPGLFVIDPRESVWRAIERAGGTLREDGIHKIQWERKNKIVSRNILKNYEAGISLYAMGVQSGDQFHVTPKPKMTSWDFFKSECLPIIGTVLSAALSFATVYIYWEVSQHP